MEASEQTRFDALYSQHLRALKLQGKAEATVDSYARAVRRTAEYFDRCPDQLSPEDFNNYFASLIDTRSWSLVKIDRCGLQFFYKHVLLRKWPWVVKTWDTRTKSENVGHPHQVRHILGQASD